MPWSVPVEYFKQIIGHFTNLKYQIIFICGTEDKILCEPLKKENVFLAAGELLLIETIELLKNASLLICNDSAPTHLGMGALIFLFLLFIVQLYRNLVSIRTIIKVILSVMMNCPASLVEFTVIEFVQQVLSIVQNCFFLKDLVIEKAEKLLSNAG